MPDFIFIGGADFYVAKGGNDSSYPTTSSQDILPATLAAQPVIPGQCRDKTLPNFVPKATLQAGCNVARAGAWSVLALRGDYKEALNSVTSVNLRGEGLVTCRGTGGNTFTVGNGGGSSITGFRITDFATANINAAATRVRCENLPNIGSGVPWNNCLLINCTVQVGQFPPAFINTQWFNTSTIGYIAALQGCDMGAGCDVYVANSAANVLNNNLRGRIAINAAGVSGNKTGVLLSLADHKTEYPALSANSFSSDPRHSSAPRLDFTLRADSPNIGKGINGQNIGGQVIARAMYPTDAVDTTAQPNPWAVANGAVYHNMHQVGNDWVLDDGVDEGYALSGPRFIGNTPLALAEQYYDGLMTYDETQPVGSGYDQVPRARINGNLLGVATYATRWRLAASRPVVDADWDNGNMLSAGQWAAFPFNEVPKIDAAGVGSAQPGFNATNAGDVGACWAQDKVTITRLK